VTIAEDDRRYRIPLEGGEVCIYTDEGDCIHFRRDKEIHIISGGKVVVEAPLVHIEGAVEIKGDVHVDGNITATGEIHDHTGGAL
jgi:phage gp45-like